MQVTEQATTPDADNHAAVLKPSDIARVLDTWDVNLDATRSVIEAGASSLTKSVAQLRAFFVENTQGAASEAECVTFAENFVEVVACLHTTEQQLEATVAMLRHARSRLMLVGIA